MYFGIICCSGSHYDEDIRGGWYKGCGENTIP